LINFDKCIAKAVTSAIVDTGPHIYGYELFCAYGSHFCHSIIWYLAKL
jgi:hypothetical protein